MKKQMLSRLGRNGKEKDVVKLRGHSKPPHYLTSGAPQGCNAGSVSSTQVVLQRQQPRPAWKMLKQVQHDGLFYNGGFTLIELLVVVLIIGILAAVALPQYKVAVEKARMTEAITVAQNVKLAQERYRLANGSYTTVVEDLDISFPGTTPTDYRIVLPSGAQIFVNVSSYVYVKNKASTLLLVLYYEHVNATLSGRKNCNAKQGNSIANQVCKSLGGINPSNASDCALIGACTVYNLP